MNSSGTATVFQQLLGAEFFHLATVVKALHVRQGQFTWRGEVSIVRGRGLLARMAAVVARLAPATAAATASPPCRVRPAAPC